MTIAGTLDSAFETTNDDTEEGYRRLLESMAWLAEGLNALGDHARQYNVPLLYEPLNRYETNLVNTVESGDKVVRVLEAAGFTIKDKHHPAETTEGGVITTEILKTSNMDGSCEEVAAKLEASYDLLLTQRLILQPQIEVNLYSKADPARLIGAGFSDIDTGLRLRYEFSRKFAPYLGVVYEGKFGQSASYARRIGESTGDFRFVFGVRIWL